MVHISSGVSGLVAGAIVGPRRHVDKELGAANAPFVILGGRPIPIGTKTFFRVEHRSLCSNIHPLELTWKWRMAPWKTIFHYKQAGGFSPP